jgi:hypothetical protein
MDTAVKTPNLSSSDYRSQSVTARNFVNVSGTSVEETTDFREWNSGRESRRVHVENEAEFYGIRREEAHTRREGKELKNEIKGNGKMKSRMN